MRRRSPTRFSSVEVVLNCAQSWSPRAGCAFGRARLLSSNESSRRPGGRGVRRIVARLDRGCLRLGQIRAVNEKSRAQPRHAYERLKLYEEQWLLESADDLEVVILRPARIFGEGEDWILPRLMGALARGRVWLPGGGRAKQTFVSAADVGRACLAASDRGRPGHSYLVGGFDSSWRDLLESAVRAVGVGGTVVNLPYDLLYLRALATEIITAPGAVVWPGSTPPT